MTAVHKPVQKTTKAEWLRTFGGSIDCPCCHRSVVGLYSPGHEWNCPIIKLNARMSLYEEAPERNEPAPEYERTLENAVIIEILEVSPEGGVRMRITFSGGGVRERWYQVRDKQNLTLHVRNEDVHGPALMPISPVTQAVQVTWSCGHVLDLTIADEMPPACPQCYGPRRVVNWPCICRDCNLPIEDPGEDITADVEPMSPEVIEELAEKHDIKLSGWQPSLAELSICPDPECHRSVMPGATECLSGHPVLQL